MSSGDLSKKPAEGQPTPGPPVPREVPATSTAYETGPESPQTVRPTSTELRRDYGTLDGQEASSSRRPPSRRQSDTARESLNSPVSMTPLSPQTTSRPKKPPSLRRTSTAKRALPHRGEEFSVDDDVSEVEEAREAVPPLATPHRTSLAPLVRSSSVFRRRPAHQVTPLPRVDSQEEDEAAAEQTPIESRDMPHSGSETAHEDNEEAEAEETAEDEDDTLSETESFTLKDRQQAINQTHPFGIRIWKPALYKKSRSVEKGAEEDIHSSPSAIVSKWLWAFNCLWTILFGWWLSLLAILGATVCFICAFDSSAVAYGKVLWGLAGYLFWPFGQFVKLKQDDRYADEDEGEGRSISEYERWQSGDLEYGRLMFGPVLTHTGSIVGRRRDSVDSSNEREGLLGRARREGTNDTEASNQKRRLFGRGEWTLGRVIFFTFFYVVIAPPLLLVSGICWFMVFWIPMGRVTLILFYHLRKRPLALSFHPDVAYARSTTKPQAILLCTYRAVGTKYWKYTVDGTNIFLVNSLVIVAAVILDYFILDVALGLKIWLTSPALLFPLAVVSIIPLAYFIGQAVASISAQSSMGMGAAVNAFFSTVVEVYLYCIALNEGKGKLVEGSIIGSIFAGILLLPGLSMCFGALRRKTQRFNQKSAGATTTMLLFATIAAFGPTLFYKMYGAHELICRTCSDSTENLRDCRQCYFRQIPAITDTFFVEAVRPYSWVAAAFLFSSYVIGLLFTLRTHAAVIWSTDEEKKPPVAPLPPILDISPKDTRQQSGTHGPLALQEGSASQVNRTNIRESQLYNRILGQTVRQAGLQPAANEGGQEAPSMESSFYESHGTGDAIHRRGIPHVVPPKTSRSGSLKSPHLRPVVPGLSEEDNNSLLHQVAEMAATAAAYAARDAVNHPKTTSYQATHTSLKGDSVRSRAAPPQQSVSFDHAAIPAGPDPAGQEEAEAGGHDAPNWSRAKSAIILLTATFAYAVIAEILVDTVDVVLDSVDIAEKFLGFTLFALVPSTTEFLNAISFAMNGNVTLSMEIGSAYALQVILLQIPALVLYSAVWGRFIDPGDLIDHTFQLIFPQWDMVTVILCVFLLSYMYSEGKSNYFKGTIMVMTYIVVLLGFHYSSYATMDIMGVNPTDTLAILGSMPWRAAGVESVPAGSFKKSEL